MNNPDRAQNNVLRGKWKLLERLVEGNEDTLPDTAEADKIQRKREYEAFNRKLGELKFGKYAFFLNYGYVQNDNPSFAKVTPRESDFDANSRRLVYEVIGDCPLDDLDVVDVSCGRGAVSIAVQGHFRPKSYLGIDLSSEAIAFCRGHRQMPNFQFEEGDAESLQLANESRDVVINIESSHNYPRIGKFFHECFRVLRPGGWFLYTDLLAPSAFDRHTQLLQAIGFTKTRDADITSNVLLACDETAERRMAVYTDSAERSYMADFLAAPGSETYHAMEQGLLCYRLFTFRKITHNS